MLDITIGLNELKFVSEIHIVAINNEVKELLWLINKDYNGVPVVKTINFNKSNTEEFKFNLDEEMVSELSEPKKYLYEPNAAIMKSGAFDLLSSKYNISKLDKHTHLYTSERLIDFPGRRFLINEVIPYHKKEIKKFLKIKKANISIRNFPESVSEIRKKHKISDGGDVFLFFTTLESKNKVIIACSKV